jgi:hypothetical protein
LPRTEKCALLLQAKGNASSEASDSLCSLCCSPSALVLLRGLSPASKPLELCLIWLASHAALSMLAPNSNSFGLNSITANEDMYCYVRGLSSFSWTVEIQDELDRLTDNRQGGARIWCKGMVQGVTCGEARPSRKTKKATSLHAKSKDTVTQACCHGPHPLPGSPI